MTKKLKIGAALLALALLPAAAFAFHIHPALIVSALVLIGPLAGGAVTFTYESFQHTGAYGGAFVGGSAVAPTAAQAAQISTMTASISFTDTDTSFVFTHNWGLSAAQAAALLPEIIWNIIGTLQALGTAVAPVLSFNVTSNTNVITVTKLQATGSGNTISMTVRRPHSVGL